MNGIPAGLIRLALAMSIFGLVACGSTPTKPLVIAHRGESAIAPENTLAAYRLAIENGIRAAECDVRASRDGMLFLLHDKTLDRTTSGRGLVNDHSWAELSMLDAGAWKGEEWRGEPLPMFAEFLELMRGRALAIVELKAEGTESKVLAELTALELDPNDVMIFSFHESVMSYLAKNPNPWPRTWLLSGDASKFDARDALFRKIAVWGLTGLGLDRRSVDRDFVERAHQAGMRVFVWTVNDEKDAQRIANLGVDAIISDRPLAIKKALGQD